MAAIGTTLFRSSSPFLCAIATLLFIAGNLVMQPALRGHGAEQQVVARCAGQPLIVEGRVVGRPENRDGGSRVMIRPLRVVAGGESLPLSGDIFLRVQKGRAALSGGDLVRFGGKLRAPRNYGIPGEFDAERYYALKGVVATSFVKDASDLLLIRRGGWSLQRWFDAVAARTGTFIMAVVPGPEGGILKALLIGDCGDIPEELKAAYSRTGVNHILSISGFHVGIIALALFHLWFALSRLFPAVLLYCNFRRFALGLSLPLVLCYLFLSGAAPATARSVIMLAFVMLGMVLEREYDHFNGLILAALVLLLLNPANLYDLSFQLSFLALWGIMALTPLFVDLLGAPAGGRWFRLSQFFAASLAAVAVTLLPVAYYFQQSTLTGLLSNFFIVPLLGYGAVIAGFVSLPLIWLFPPGAAWLLTGAGFLVNMSNRIIGQLDRLPLLPDFAPTEAGIALFLAGLLLLTLVPRRGQKLRVLAGVPPLLLVVQLLPVDRPGNGMRIDFFSVGQGESSLLTFANGQRMLIDGGGALHEGGWDPGRRLLLPCLRRMGGKRVDYLGLSHPHPDHLQGVLAVAESLPVGEFWETGIEEGDDYRRLKQTLVARQVPVKRVCARQPPLVIGEARVTILSPAVTPAVAVGDLPDVNESSLVLRVDEGRFGALFTGDIGFATESLLLQHPERLRATVLKVPHHGSRYSALPAFFQAVSPKVALIGAGYGNSFGLPSRDALDGLRKTSCAVYRTDLDGTVTITGVNDGENLVISGVKRHFN